MAKEAGKPGALSLDERQFIRDNAIKMKVADIAKAINKREGSIVRFIQGEGIACLDDIPNVDDEYVKILKELKQKAFYDELKLQLDDDELKYFSSHWIDLILQFKNDVLAAEAMQIKELIVLDILVNRCMRKRLMARKDIERYTKLLEDEYQKLPANRNQEDLILWESQLGQSKTAEQNITAEQNKLQNDKKELYKSLKATRDQRFSKVESGEKTFMTLLKLMYEEDQRQREGQMAELIRLSTEKQREKLMELHSYGDSQVDVPLLNDRSVMLMKEEEYGTTSDSKVETTANKSDEVEL